jgi:hypothetical protein
VNGVHCLCTVSITDSRSASAAILSSTVLARLTELVEASLDRRHFLLGEGELRAAAVEIAVHPSTRLI